MVLFEFGFRFCMKNLKFHDRLLKNKLQSDINNNLSEATDFPMQRIEHLTQAKEQAGNFKWGLKGKFLFMHDLLISDGLFRRTYCCYLWAIACIPYHTTTTSAKCSTKWSTVCAYVMFEKSVGIAKISSLSLILVKSPLSTVLKEIIKPTNTHNTNQMHQNLNHWLEEWIRPLDCCLAA